MTWKELKEWLNEHIKDDEKIWYIDISFPDSKDLVVSRGKSLGISVT